MFLRPHAQYSKLPSGVICDQFRCKGRIRIARRAFGGVMGARAIRAPCHAGLIDAYSAGSPAILSRKTLMPKITIIEAGLISREVRARHGSFPQMFERMIRAADASASFATVRLADGEGLPDPVSM